MTRSIHQRLSLVLCEIWIASLLYTVAVTHHPADTLKGFCRVRFTTLILIEIFLVPPKVKDEGKSESIQLRGPHNRHSAVFSDYLWRTYRSWVLVTPVSTIRKTLRANVTSVHTMWPWERIRRKVWVLYTKCPLILENIFKKNMWVI